MCRRGAIGIIGSTAIWEGSKPPKVISPPRETAGCARSLLVVGAQPGAPTEVAAFPPLGKLEARLGASPTTRRSNLDHCETRNINVVIILRDYRYA